MNGDSLDKQLPELTDDDIKILDLICKRAIALGLPPYTSLYNCYEAVLKELGIEERHERVLFRWLSSIADAVNQAQRNGRPISIVNGFRHILAAQNVTIIDDDEPLSDDEEPRPVGVRRVSFDNAHYEETWLSAHTQTLDIGTPEHHLVQPSSFRGRRLPTNGHARANSVPNNGIPKPQGRLKQPATRDAGSEAILRQQHDEATHAEVLAQLEDKADAILDIKTMKCSRHLVVTWRNALRSLQVSQAYDDMRAMKHDFRVLTRQVWEIWAAKATFRHLKRQDEARRIAAEELLASSGFDLRRKVFSQWLSRLEDAERVNRQTRNEMLAFRYFMRWKTIALENAFKQRIILVKKFFTRWHELSLQRRTDPDSVVRMWKRRIVRKYFGRLKQSISEIEAGKQYTVTLKRRSLLQWRETVQQATRKKQEADDLARSNHIRAAMLRLQNDSRALTRDVSIATESRNSSLLSRAFATLQKEASLLPRLRSYQKDVNTYLLQKTIDAWQDVSKAAQSASDWRRQQILKHIFTSWSHALRVRTMASQINERIKADCLFKLFMSERLRLFCRNTDIALTRRTLNAMRQKAQTTNLRLDNQATSYRYEAQRRAKTHVFQHVHLVNRQRDDAARLAIEFANSKLMPRVMPVWQQKAQQIRVIGKWGADAHFFMVTKKCIRVWHDRMINARQEKRRLAYESMRKRIKTRVAKTCFAALIRASSAVGSMHTRAVEFDGDRISSLAVQTLHEMAFTNQEQKEQYQNATDHDLANLLRGVLSNLAARHGYIVQNDELADAFRVELDQGMLAIVLKRLSFAAFTAARLEDNGRMLHERLLQQHQHQMLRYLATVAKDRKAARSDETDLLDREPESPSARPASRAASRSGITSSAIWKRSTTASGSRTGTPAYLRTPPRGRKGRFRPLPTPAPYTPLAFTPGFVTSTPVPVRDMPDASMLSTSTTPQITPFERKLRAGGVSTGTRLSTSLRRNVLTRSVGPDITGTSKSVRFLGSGIKIMRGSPAEHTPGSRDS